MKHNYNTIWAKKNSSDWNFYFNFVKDVINTKEKF